MSSYWKIDHRRKLNRSKLYEINIHINLDIYLVTTDKTKCIRNNHFGVCSVRDHYSMLVSFPVALALVQEVKMLYMNFAPSRI